MCLFITMCLLLQVIDECGSFDNYRWSFVNPRPILTTFMYPFQVPVKASIVDVITKDLVSRGFRSVGSTVVYISISIFISISISTTYKGIDLF
jgi:DNA-3-methyladenine glycosylase I